MFKKRSLILILAIIFSLTFISASVSNLGTFKQGGCINLLQTCADCTYNNISSVIFPDSTQALGEVIMAKISTQYNYTFCNANQLGTYTVSGFGDPGTIKTLWTYTFEVTTTGDNMGISLWVALIMISISLILFIISLYADNQYIGFVTGVSFIVSGIYILIYGFGAMSDMYTRTIAIVLFGFGLIVFFISAFHEYGNKDGLAQYFGTDKEAGPDEYDHFGRDDN